MLRNTMVVAAFAAAFLAWTFASRRYAEPRTTRPPAIYRDFEGVDSLASVAILRFYASTATVNEGDPATLCYGVAKAKSVRLDPPAEPLSPSLNRCVQVSPTEDTRYTLTAEGEDGRTVSESFVLRVNPDPNKVPRVIYFIGQKKGDPKEPVYSLCFAVENALRVSVDPPVIPSMDRAPRGCFYVAPKETTTYTLIAAGEHGRSAVRRYTVRR